jgi:transcriptional regulator with XRE-family HTH domain
MQLNLKDARSRKGWTLAELSSRTGVHKSTLSRIERGETVPLYTTVRSIETALGLRRGALEFTEAVVA